MKKIYYLLLTLMVTSLSFGQDMVITGAFDGPLTNGTPKLIEVYVINDITDLSTYGIGSANNGDGTDGQELAFTGSATAGDFIYITDGGNSGVVNLMTYFGIEADYVNGLASINGDDALELFSGGVVIDTFGELDGSGTGWDYLDGWAYRTSSTGPDGATFTIANWTFSGINATDSCESNSTCASEFPIGSFTNSVANINNVTVESSQAWNGYVNAFNVSDNVFAFGFPYGAADLRATATATSMTLEPNIAIWTGEATNVAWFDTSSGSQVPVKYIEASSYIENNALAGSDLNFSGTVSVDDLDAGYVVVAFVKALDPNNGYATVVNNTTEITTAGPFIVSATAAELTTGLIIQYGFTMTGLPADPTVTTNGSVVVGTLPSDPCDGVTGAPAIADDFEGNSVDILEYAGDNNVTYSTIDGTSVGSTSNVLQYVDGGGVGSDYANLQLRTCNKFDMAVTNFFTMDVYIVGSSLSGAQPNQVSFKLQDRSLAGNAYTTQVEVVVPVTAVDTWQTVEFDFIASSARTDFDQVVIQFNLEANLDTVTAYIDNLVSSTSVQDTTPPVIELVGVNPQELTVGDAYVELGAAATDDTDDDTALTATIAIDATAVDTATAGSYSVTYDVSDAAGNAATQVIRTVTVEAAAITSFPYCSSFDADLGDWSTEIVSGTVDWVSSAATTNNGVAANSGGGSAYYYSGSYAGHNSTLISGTLDLSSVVSPQLTFQIANPDWSGDQDTLQVWYKAAAADEWSVLGTYTDATTTFSEVTLALPNASSDYYIAFNATSGYGYGVMIDDVCVAEAPACITPTNLSVSGVTTTSATLNWVSDGNAFMIEILPSGLPQGTAGGYVIGDVTPYTSTSVSLLDPLTGEGVLTSNTSYDFYVVNVCDYSADGTNPIVVNEQSEYAGPFTFTTNPECGDSISFTYENNFNGIAYSFSAPSGQYASVTAGGQTESCCDDMWITDGSGNALYGSQASPTAGSLSGTYESTDGTILIYVNSDSSVNDTMTFAFSCYDPPATVPDCATNFTNTVDANCGNEDFTVSWDTVVGAGGYLITAGTSSGGNDLADAVDLIATSYAFTAVPGQSYYYTVTPYNLIGNAEDCVEQTITLSSTICTPCDSAVSLTPGTQQSGNTADFGDLFDDSLCLGSYGNGDDAIYSYVATEDGETMTVTVNFTATWGGVSMSLGCPSGDSTAYTCVGSVTNGSSTGTNSFTSDDLIAGETYYIHISTYPTPQSTAYTLDTLVIEAPACLAPSDLVVSSITTTTASVAWIANNSETSWEYQVVESDATPVETGDATSDNPLALTGLTSNTSYDVYVRANCGTDFSAWSMVTFTTPPAPIVPDYMNDFTTFPGDLWTTDNGVLNSFGGWVADGFANDGSSGAAKINIYTSSVGPKADDALISPSFDLSGGNYYLNMTAALTPWNGTANGAFGNGDYVSVSVTEDAGDTWVELYRWDSTNNPTAAGDAMPELNLSSYASSSVYVKIFASSGTEVVDNDFFIDDFSITSTTLGLEDVSTVSNFTFFPNPVNNVLTIKAQASIDSITVYNMLGQAVVRSTPNTNDSTVDMSALQTGAYFVQVSINNTLKTVRVIKN